ncbi:MAG: ion transporter [Phycisphaerae bacterium]|nr:ion transporter [Phycisphaerae bacterium]
MDRQKCLKIRKRVREIVVVARPGDIASRAFDIAIVALILLNVTAMIAESVQRVYLRMPRFFTVFEYTSVAVFSVEYAMRLWSCVEETRYSRPVLGRLRFALTPLALVDLLAVLPFYLPFVNVDLRVLRVLRVMRIMRLAKLGRYSESLQTLGRVVAARKEQLLSTVFILLILLVISSCLMYYGEHEAQPQSFSSIPAAMWWAVATLTTVGYGDVCPITPIGKLMASVIAVLGIGMFALPTGILGAGFVEEINSRKRVKRCPHCGNEIEV